MEWENVYPKLSRFQNLRNFLGVAFPESDLENWSDEEAAHHYVAENVPVVRALILEEGRNLLAEPDIPWEEISKAANRYFESEDEARQWLINIIRSVETSEPHI